VREIVKKGQVNTRLNPIAINSGLRFRANLGSNQKLQFLTGKNFVHLKDNRALLQPVDAVRRFYIIIDPKHFEANPIP